MPEILKSRIKFIVNPFAGIGNKKNFQDKLALYLDNQRFDYNVEYTTHPGHAKSLAQEAITKDFDIIVAVGGDGSVNEVATQLVNTDKILGIIPAGSGNGFAGHLGYSRNIAKSIKSLNTAKVVQVDSCMLNDKPYFNVAGVGFDAWVAYKTKENKFRGFLGYMKTALNETIAYKLKKFIIKIDGKTIERECLCIEVANATMFGYNMKIAPLAKFDDGLLDVVIIKKVPKLRYVPSMIRFPIGNVHKSSLVEYFKAKEVEIILTEDCAAHIDGEGFLVKGSLKFSLKKLSLSVLKPESNV